MVAARYTWDLKTLERGFSIHFRTQSSQTLGLAAGFLLILFGLVELLTAEEPLVDGIPPLTVGLLLLLITRPILYRRFRRSVCRAPMYGGEVTWTFDSQRAAFASRGSVAEFPWENLYSVTMSPEGFLLYPTRSSFHWIPAKAFATERDLETVRSFIVESGVRRRKA